MRPWVQPQVCGGCGGREGEREREIEIHKIIYYITQNEKFQRILEKTYVEM
jgi:hypothetical protein